jgi:predicted nucleic acid-binding protein
VVNAVIDSNILIDYLNGAPQASEEITRYIRPAICTITWIEVLVGIPPAQEPAARAFLATFELQELDAPIAEEAIRLRRQHRIKLPDAIIWATARVGHALLVTRNSRDFPSNDPGIRIPYVI